MPVQHITELFALDGRAFVTEAYRNLLKREPDEHGMAYYLGRLALGYGKSSVIAQLANGSEYRTHGEIKGLKELITHEQRDQHWFWGLFTRRTKYILQATISHLEAISQRHATLNNVIECQSQSIKSINIQIEELIKIRPFPINSKRYNKSKDDVFQKNKIYEKKHKYRLSRISLLNNIDNFTKLPPDSQKLILRSVLEVL